MQEPLLAATATLKQFLALNQAQKLKSTEAKALLTGEAAQRWDTDTLGNFALQPSAMKLVTPKAVVGRVLFTSPALEIDGYFYLSQVGGQWKVEAYRSLSLIGILYEAREQLKKQAKRTPDDERQLANLELTLATDKALRAHFEKNVALFEQLRRNPKDTALVHKLHLTSAERTRNQSVNLTIGGMTDNVVGYLWTTNPPPISPSRYIWVEALKTGWYLYRTT